MKRLTTLMLGLALVMSVAVPTMSADDSGKPKKAKKMKKGKKRRGAN